MKWKFVRYAFGDKIGKHGVDRQFTGKKTKLAVGKIDRSFPQDGGFGRFDREASLLVQTPKNLYISGPFGHMDLELRFDVFALC